ncbi:hypothetical protein NUACC21_34560 [Scytonema sp. NUACC21]
MDILTLSALAEIRKHTVIQAKDLYPDSYLYAIGNMVHPIFEEDILDNQFDEDQKSVYYPFFKIYKITYEQVTDVHHFLIKEWGQKKDIKFRDLEKHYKTIFNISDIEDCLIKICRYLFLHGEFEKQFWDSLVLNHNLRVSEINKEFRISEIFSFLKP